VGLSLFTLVEVSAALLEPLRQLALFFSFALALTFLLYPLFPHASSRLFLSCDLLLASLSSAVGIYITLDYWDLIFRAGMPTRLDLAVSVVAVLLVLESTRRTLGKHLVIINGIFYSMSSMDISFPLRFLMADMIWSAWPPPLP
jgi:TRAP-type uncharacterized transport system fused permease subunit